MSKLLNNNPRVSIPDIHAEVDGMHNRIEQLLLSEPDDRRAHTHANIDEYRFDFHQSAIDHDLNDILRDASLNGLDNMSEFNRMTLDGMADNIIAEIQRNGFQHLPGSIDQDFIDFLLDDTLSHPPPENPKDQRQANDERRRRFCQFFLDVFLTPPPQLGQGDDFRHHPVKINGEPILYAQHSRQAHAQETVEDLIDTLGGNVATVFQP